MDETLLTNLLTSLKGKLRITWNDEDNDLNEIIEGAYDYLCELAGFPLDISKENQSKTLLLERCRYVYNNVADEFEKNFKHELSRFIILSAIK